MRVVGVKYNTKQLVLQPKLAWKGAMQVNGSKYASCTQVVTITLLNQVCSCPNKPAST